MPCERVAPSPLCVSVVGVVVPVMVFVAVISSRTAATCAATSPTLHVRPLTRADGSVTCRRFASSHIGRRPRTVYRITPAGRRALKAWLAVPSTMCGSFEWDALVKVFLSDHGTKEHLLAQLHAMQEANRADDAWHRDVWAQRLRDRPFAQRMHINALVSRFFVEFTAAADRWAEWALHEVESWETVAEPPAELDELLQVVFAPMDERATQ